MPEKKTRRRARPNPFKPKHPEYGEKAFEMYCLGFSDVQIKAALGVSCKALAKWRREERWEQRKAAQHSTDETILAICDQLTGQLKQRVDSGDYKDLEGMADILSKISNSRERVRKSSDLGPAAMLVFEEFKADIQRNADQDTLDALRPHLKRFTDHLAAKLRLVQVQGVPQGGQA